VVTVVETTGVGLRAAAQVEILWGGTWQCARPRFVMTNKADAAETKKLGACFVRIEGMKCCSPRPWVCARFLSRLASRAAPPFVAEWLEPCA